MKNYFDLSGRTAVITGASTGLGLQMAKAFASQGANIVLLARRKELLEKNAETIKSEFGVKALPFVCDVTVTKNVIKAVNATMQEFGRVDILVNNAGTGGIAPSVEITDAQFDNEIKVDLFGTFVCSREFAKVMIKQRYGRIINIALGDVDNNKSINAVDASYILEEYAKLSTNKKSGFSDDQNFAADVNKDGKVNAVDASYILSYYAYCSTTSGVKMSLADYMKKA